MKSDLLNFLLSKKNITIRETLNEFLITKNQLVNIINEINNDYYSKFHISFVNESFRINIYDFETLFKSITKETKANYNEIENRKRYILKKLLASPPNEYIKIDEISEELFVSRGTINNDITSLRKDIKRDNLQITGVPNRGIKITGAQIKKWILYTHNITYEELVNKNHNFASGLEQKLEILISNLKTKYHINFQTELHLKKTLLLTQFNISNKIRLGPNENFMFELRADNFLCSQVYKFLNMEGMVPSNNELLFAISPLFSKELINEKNYYYNEKIVNSIYSKIVEDIENQIITSIDYEKLYEEIKYHLFLVLVRTYFKIETPDFIWEEMKFKFPLSYELATISVKTINKFMNLNVALSEISYLAVYFQKYLSSESIEKFNVALLSDYSDIVNRLIKKELYDLIGNDIDIKCYTTRECSDINFDNISLILSTTNIDRINNIPIYQVEDVFDKEKFAKQLSVLTLKRITEKNDVIIHAYGTSHFKSYLEIIRIISENLTKNNFVDQNFTQRIIDKELQKPTIFSNGIALPHTISDTKEIICCYCYLDKPISYNNFVINSIVLLAVPKELDLKQESTLLEIYEHLFSLANKDSKNIKFMRDFVEHICYENIVTNKIQIIK